MKVERSFHGDEARYFWDNGMCNVSNGFAQMDTDQDAWYYGAWANPFKLITVEYAEGDLIIKRAETEIEFIDSVRHFASLEMFKGIDPMLNENIQNRFKELGLTDLLHESCR